MPTDIDLDQYDYPLPPESIAQHPTPERDGARLLVLERAAGRRTHGRIVDLVQWLHSGDLLVVNSTRVLSARLRGHKDTGGAAEALILGPEAPASGRFRALVKTRGRLRNGLKFRFGRDEVSLDAELVAHAEDGEVTLAFEPGADPYAIGEMPLPPYIRRSRAEAEDCERYQTAYARVPGSIAAPTAGLHLSERLLAELDQRGVERAEVVLHVGVGTFRPLRPEDLACGRLHSESIELSETTAEQIAATRARGGRVIAVGTTSARVLEACATGDGQVRATRGDTDLFLAPGATFRVVDGLLSNFHLPRSSLLLLVAAFAGRATVLDAYAEAVQAGYRFYSYGDAMLIV
jgi:S-adenosylmethionine:tRNA ribosyltransferase-isomerase